MQRVCGYPPCFPRWTLSRDPFCFFRMPTLLDAPAISALQNASIRPSLSAQFALEQRQYVDGRVYVAFPVLNAALCMAAAKHIKAFLRLLWKIIGHSHHHFVHSRPTLARPLFTLLQDVRRCRVFHRWERLVALQAELVVMNSFINTPSLRALQRHCQSFFHTERVSFDAIAFPPVPKRHTHLLAHSHNSALRDRVDHDDVRSRVRQDTGNNERNQTPLAPPPSSSRPRSGTSTRVKRRMPDHVLECGLSTESTARSSRCHLTYECLASAALLSHPSRRNSCTHAFMTTFTRVSFSSGRKKVLSVDGDWLLNIKADRWDRTDVETQPIVCVILNQSEPPIYRRKAQVDIMKVQEAASHLLACPRPRSERNAKRQRTIQKTLDVNWHEKIEDGKVYISISSEEGDEEEDEKQEQVAQELARPDILAIDISSDEEDEHLLEMKEAEEQEEPIRVKRKLRVLEDEEEEEEKKSKEVPIAENVVKKQQKERMQQWQIATRQHVVWDQHHVPGVRKRRLGEEDAAFLLFYGDRETPGANILRLIVELISAGVGATNDFLSKFVKYLIWCKLSSMVEAGLASERLVQSEWTKIVFSCPIPPHRRRSGPMRRPDLLPRPITITVRPLQFARKQAQRHTSCASKSSVEAATKQGSLSASVTPQVAAIAQANRLTEKGAQSRAKSPKKSTKRAQTKSPRGEVRKLPLCSTTSNQPVAFSPRKHRRQSNEIDLTSETPRQAVHAKSSSSQSISQKLSEPLPSNCRTLGENRSLPIGWKAPDHYEEQDPSGKLRIAGPVEVNPMLLMTADEIAQHVVSLRREGRFTSFEKATDILLKLMSDPRNRHGVFNTPVDPVALQLPTYTAIVRRPMDLGTVKRNLAAGDYLELEDFVSDVRLVFENAMLFNPKSHYIHVDAEILMNRFNELVKAEQKRQEKRQRVQHVCLVCRGNTCIVCHQQCLDIAQPNLQCSAGCSTEIRKGSVYFISKDGTRVWCQKCKARMERDRSPTDRTRNDTVDMLADSLIKKKYESDVEPWVKCGECERWLHQVCGLYNPVIGAYESHKTLKIASKELSGAANPYVCPLCRCRRKRATPPPKSPMRKILNADPDEHAQNSSCLNIPSCELSIFIQNFLRRGLNEAGEYDAARTLYVRALSFPGERMAVPEGVVRAFDENSQLLAQLRPDIDTSSQRIPAHISYLSRGLYLFQKHEGMEVCLFTIYAQEFGDDCELKANRRAVYIAYLDSVRYLKPASARTAAYHLILLAYFDYVRRHGFSRVHIWSCPPQKRISYVFWCRPAFQKTPSSEHLRRWYNQLLLKAKECGIVKDWTTLYDQYFGDNVCSPTAGGDSELPTSFVSMSEKYGVGVSTRGTTVQSVNPDELLWPAKQLPPLFDGDIIPSELVRILGRILSRNEKQKRSSENKKFAARDENNSFACESGEAKTGGEVWQVKKEGSSASPGVPPPPQVDVRVREVFSKCQFAVQRLKQDLLVVNLEQVAYDETKEDDGAKSTHERGLKGCHPETLVPSWHGQVPRLFGSRFMFHQLCSYAGYQFDSLRRAKHSTMMMLHHYFNEQVVQLNVFCRECSLLITRADFWSCRICARYALCDACYERQMDKHPHQLVFGSAPLQIPQISERPVPPVQPPTSKLLQVEQIQSARSEAPVQSLALPTTVNVCELC